MVENTLSISRIKSAVIGVAREGTLGMQTAWEIKRREWAPRLVFGLGVLLTLGSLAVMLFPSLPLPLISDGARERHDPPIDEHFALQVLISCFLPPLLAWLSYLLINKRAVCQHIRPRVSPDLEGAALADLAASSWEYELGRAQWFLSRAEVFAGLWGMIATISIVGAVTFLLPPFRAAGHDFEGPRTMVALAVIGATVTSFMLELARVCIRTANDDGNKRMFAEALRTLILAVISTLALVLLLRITGPQGISDAIFKGSDVQCCLVALGLGAGVAVLGPPAFDWIRARVATVLGIERKKRDAGTPLEALDDVGDSEIARLAEEGIESVESLIHTSIPRLFLNTQFSLQRIASWHDFGLLVVRVGTAAAADLRHRFGISGVTEIRRMKLHGSPDSAKTLREVFKKNMRVDSDDEAELVVQQIADDERVALINVFRHTVIEKNDCAPS